jgi:hypothetical protein
VGSERVLGVEVNSRSEGDGLARDGGVSEWEQGGWGSQGRSGDGSEEYREG